jgi:hypothetical protein
VPWICAHECRLALTWPNKMAVLATGTTD